MKHANDGCGLFFGPLTLFVHFPLFGELECCCLTRLFFSFPPNMEFIRLKWVTGFLNYSLLPTFDPLRTPLVQFRAATVFTRIQASSTFTSTVTGILPSSMCFGIKNLLLVLKQYSCQQKHVGGGLVNILNSIQVKLNRKHFWRNVDCHKK